MNNWPVGPRGWFTGLCISNRLTNPSRSRYPDVTHTGRTSAMELATVFKLSIYALSAFVGVVLGFAERGWVPFLSLPVAILAYYWYDVRALRRENRPRGLGEIKARILAFLGL